MGMEFTVADGNLMKLVVFLPFSRNVLDNVNVESNRWTLTHTRLKYYSYFYSSNMSNQVLLTLIFPRNAKENLLHLLLHYYTYCTKNLIRSIVWNSVNDHTRIFWTKCILRRVRSDFDWQLSFSKLCKNQAQNLRTCRKCIKKLRSTFKIMKIRIRNCL